MTDHEQQEAAAIGKISSRVPLTGLVARRLVLKCFEEKDQWARQDLANAVENLHIQAGGLPGSQPAVIVVKKVLGELRAEGLVQPVSKGLWRYVADPDSSDGTADSTEEAAGEVLLEEDEEVGLQATESIGEGSESVYLYYNPNDKRLAQLEGRSTWECKIGQTGTAVSGRILGQGVRTALSHSPIIELVIRTDDARTLESMLHRSLRLVDAAIVDAGSEWFMTSPERVKAWYFAYTHSLRQLRGDPADGGSG